MFILVKLVLLLQMVYLASQLVDIVILSCNRLLSFFLDLECECLQIFELLDRYEVVLVDKCRLVLLLLVVGVV